MNISFSYSHDLVPSPFNPNIVPADNLDKLRESLKRLGNFRPIVVREVDGKQQVIAGWHRTLIARETDAMVPVVNLGEISDQKAKEICLLDNARFGTNDPDLFADMLKSMEISLDELSEFLPGHFDDLELGDIDLESLDLEPPESEGSKATATHTTLKFRVPIVDSHIVTHRIEEVIAELGLSENNSSAEAAGEALLWIFNNQSEVS